MADQPKRTWRRFFRFKISTWFVLVGIVVWAMACRPYLVTEPTLIFGPTYVPGARMVTGFTTDPNKLAWLIDRQRVNPSLLWPALALAAFLAWKGFWVIRERRRSPSKNQDDIRPTLPDVQ